MRDVLSGRRLRRQNGEATIDLKNRHGVLFLLLRWPSSHFSIASQSPALVRAFSRNFASHRRCGDGSWVLSYSPMASSKFQPARWAIVSGQRRVLTRIVVWWSAFTCLTGAAVFLPQLLGDPISVRRRRSGSLSEHGRSAGEMVSHRRAGAYAGLHLGGQSLRRSAGADSGRSVASLRGMATDIRRSSARWA